jgi:hypothetical protein
LRGPDGELEHVVHEAVLVVAVKADCDGCRSFYDDDGSAFGALATLIVARSWSEQFAGFRQPVWVAPELFDALDVKAPPLYVLVGANPARVLTEGVAFRPDQVMDEIRRHLGT